ncbi:MAG: caspase family protein, partial [Humidesulfovibrio sp.]|nr:caspase family protein [Humidesulfovibrio sp.]
MRRFIAFMSLACLVLALVHSAQATQPQERRVALVIGNGSYKAAPLKNPVNDARDMAAALKALGFDVTLLTDAGQQEMDTAVREFGLKLRQGGSGLFYYAGHGLQVSGENYLVPVGANIQTESDVRYTCLPAGMVLGKMEDARNDLNIIILDACRNNPFARSFRNSEQGLAKMDAPTGSLISYATAPGSVASDGAGRNGLFTQHLLKNMATPGLPITEVFMRVRQSVVAETKRKQVPWEASSLIGQFYFSGAAKAQQQGIAPVALSAAPSSASLVSSAPALAAPALAAPAKALDLKAEKKRMVEEAARLKREQQELSQLQALQAEKHRLDAERQKLEQAKLLALAPRPKQTPLAPLPAQSFAPQAGAHAAQFAALARAVLPDARAYFEQAVQAHPGDAEARAGLVIAHVFSGHEADTKYQLQRLNESSAQTAGVRLAKGLLLGLEGNPDADYQFNRALEEQADRALTLLCQASVAARKGDYKKGQRLLAEYSALVPESERAGTVAGLAKSLDVESAMVGR